MSPLPQLRALFGRLRDPAGGRRWLWAVAAVWTVELMVVQELTLTGAAARTFWSPMHGVVRLLLDALLCGAMVHMLPRVSLAAIQVVALGFLWMVLSYHAHYLQALSVVSVLANLREGIQVADGGLSVLAMWHYGFAGSMALKLYLLWQAGDTSRILRRRGDGFALVGLYAVLLLVAQLFGKPLTKLARWETVGGVGRVYGYTPSWIAELAFFDEKRLLERALERAKIREDRLRPREAPLEIGDHLVFLQVESLDQAVMGFTIDGQEVTPRLNELARTSMTYAVQAPKKTGSCDADFQAITGKLFSGEVPNYKIPGFPYDDALPHALRARNWETQSVHGVSGRFFNRRMAFDKMGFDRIVFLEEIERDTDLEVTDWAVFDHELLDLAAGMLEPGKKQFQIAITVTSHVPFRHIPELPTSMTGGSSVEDRYFDVIHYVDGAIGNYVDALPDDTVVVIYGDHTSRMELESVGYEQQMRDGVGVVPFLIHRKGRDLSKQQRVTGEPATSGELTLLDALSYVHHAALRG